MCELQVGGTFRSKTIANSAGSFAIQGSIAEAAMLTHSIKPCLTTCIGFTWQSFGSSCRGGLPEKTGGALCWTELVPYHTHHRPKSSPLARLTLPLRESLKGKMSHGMGSRPGSEKPQHNQDHWKSLWYQSRDSSAAHRKKHGGAGIALQPLGKMPQHSRSAFSERKLHPMERPWWSRFFLEDWSH